MQGRIGLSPKRAAETPEGGHDMDSKSGHQTIGCEVTSCRFNKQGCECNLDRIEIKPCSDCHTGDKRESLCGSYIAK